MKTVQQTIAFSVVWAFIGFLSSGCLLAVTHVLGIPWEPLIPWGVFTLFGLGCVVTKEPG